MQILRESRSEGEELSRRYTLSVVFALGFACYLPPSQYGHNNHLCRTNHILSNMLCFYPLTTFYHCIVAMLTHHTIRKLYKGETKLQQDHSKEHDCRQLDQANTLK